MEISDGKIFRGVFSTWVPGVELVLKQAWLISNHNTNNNPINGFSINANSVVEELYIATSHILRCQVVDTIAYFNTNGNKFYLAHALILQDYV